MHILGTYIHIHIKYEVSVFNPVTRRAMHTDAEDADAVPTPRTLMITLQDGQFKITFGITLNEPKQNARTVLTLPSLFAYIYICNIHLSNGRFIKVHLQFVCSRVKGDDVVCYFEFN